MQRVSVVGNSGSGKSTFALALAARLDAPCLELDAVFHQPGWTELPLEQFRARVEEFTAGDRWVVDGNYRARVQNIVWGRADTVIWLDYPKYVAVGRVVRRTLRRAITRAELWNGNREGWRNALSRDPTRSIIVWSWTQHANYRALYAEATTAAMRPGLTVVRARSPRDAARLLGSV